MHGELCGGPYQVQLVLLVKRVAVDQRVELKSVRLLSFHYPFHVKICPICFLLCLVSTRRP